MAAEVAAVWAGESSVTMTSAAVITARSTIIAATHRAERTNVYAAI